jgi:hypothetical protein
MSGVSANTLVSLIVKYESNIEGGGDCSNGPIVPARRPFVPWMGVAVSETRAALACGDHYREMAGRLRGLARLTRSPGVRRELGNLAKRYDRRGDHLTAGRAREA